MKSKIYKFDHIYLGEFLFSCTNVPCITEVLNNDPEQGQVQVRVRFLPEYGIGRYLEKVYRTLPDRYKGNLSEADADLSTIQEEIILTKKYPNNE